MSVPHGEVWAAALRQDLHAVRAAIRHLDEPATRNLRHAACEIAEACWDRETDFIRAARKEQEAA